MQFLIHVSAVILDKRGRILLVKENKLATRNKWNFPGGHLNPGEELVAGVMREAKEETNLNIKVKSLIGIYTGQRENHYINFVFKAAISSGRVAVDHEEIQELKWYTLTELSKIPKSTLLNRRKFARILKDLRLNRNIPVGIISEKMYPDTKVDNK
jgi:8-oxo-dGTP diphosphatase